MQQQQNLSVTLLTNDVNLRNKSLLSSISAVSVRKLKGSLGREQMRSCDSINTDKSVSVRRLSDSESQGSEEMPEKVMEIVLINHQTLSQKRDCLREKKKSNLGKSTKGVMAPDGTPLSDIEASLSKTLSKILETVFIESYGDDLWKKIVIHKPPWTLSEVFSCWDKHWIAAFNDKFPHEVKDLVMELNGLLSGTPSEREIRRIHKKVESLYRIFERSPYKDYVVAVGASVLDFASDCAMSETNQEAPESERFKDNSEENSSQDGLINLKEMINLVGMYITHFM